MTIPIEHRDRAGRHHRVRAVKNEENRRRILATLYPASGDWAHWWFRYGVMLSLSIVVAVMGLSLNSTAVVIGAMLIAPLMTPVLGVSTALALAWPKWLGRSVLAVVAGSVGSIGLAWVLTLLLPSADRVLTPEVLSRTSPDLRDLLVALAAGAAGAYATVREDVSAALPGVAVAVALVPPLGVIGFTLAIGRTDLASGALLLYSVNLLAIVLVGWLVLLASGFVPTGRLRAAPVSIRIGIALAAVAALTLAVPLTVTSLRIASQAQTSQAVNQAVVNWLQSYPSLKVTGVSIKGHEVTVQVQGSVAPPATQSLSNRLVRVLGSDAAARVQWFQTAEATSPASASTLVLSDQQVRPLVQEWLTSALGKDNAMIILAITINSDQVGVILAGPTAAPSASTLAASLSALAGRAVTVSVTTSITK
ncbi:MAG TPA: TIGR00341 family protein [Acidimicrobiales bacterium]|nr:TIGR00341 family protein [Acidimicrobiales bacterium]